MVRQETTKRSHLDATHLVERLQEQGVEELAGEEEVWVMLDGSDLRKPHAQKMEALQRVRRLEGKGTVKGYQTLNAIGIGKERRGILYHRLFSSHEEGYQSEPAEVQQALGAIGQALQGKGKKVIYALDRGFDDIAVWGSIWEQGNSLVCRLCHLERLVEQPQEDGNWEKVNLERAAWQLRDVAQVETRMVVQKKGQSYAKLQRVKATIASCPVRVSYQVDTRKRRDGAVKSKECGLVRVTLEGVGWEPWWLLTDLLVRDAQEGPRVFLIYRQRWAVEDTFKFTKECLGWEEVQVLKLEGVRTLVALGWVAAGFLFQLGVSLEWPEVRLLARLGGWEARKERKPGRTILSRGLRRLLDMLATEAVLQDEIERYGQLPPKLARLIGRAPS